MVHEARVYDPQFINLTFCILVLLLTSLIPRSRSDFSDEAWERGYLFTHFALLSTFARQSAVSRFTTTETGILVRAVFPSSPREVTSPSLSWAEEEEVEEEEEGGGLKNKSA